MGHPIEWSQVSNLIQMTVLLLCIVTLAINQHRKKVNIQFVMVMCAMGCYFASDLYWTVFLAMKPNYDLPAMSPVELGELGMCLFFVSAMNVESLGQKKMSAWKYLIISLFCLTNAAFWYFWTESVLNTAVTLVGAWPMCVIAIHGIDSLGSVSKKAWVGFNLGFILVMAAEIGQMLFEGTAFRALELFSYFMWLIGWVNLLVFWFKEIRNKSEAGGLGAVPFRLTVNMLCLGTYSLYSSSGVMYIICDSLMTVACGLMVYSLVRRDYKYDLL